MMDAFTAMLEARDPALAVCIESESGKRTKTSDHDRKGIILNRICRFLTAGAVPPEICFTAAITCFDGLPSQLTPDDRAILWAVRQ
jgi:hypothetical protein